PESTADPSNLTETYYSPLHPTYAVSRYKGCNSICKLVCATSSKHSRNKRLNIIVLAVNSDPCHRFVSQNHTFGDCGHDDDCIRCVTLTIEPKAPCPYYSSAVICRWGNFKRALIPDTLPNQNSARQRQQKRSQRRTKKDSVVCSG